MKEAFIPHQNCVGRQSGLKCVENDVIKITSMKT
jgi:hypothetical protein